MKWLRLLIRSFFFFFQAEDGIRDAQESRGLGDVYKRQNLNQANAASDKMAHEAAVHAQESAHAHAAHAQEAAARDAATHARHAQEVAAHDAAAHAAHQEAAAAHAAHLRAATPPRRLESAHAHAAHAQEAAARDAATHARHAQEVAAHDAAAHAAHQEAAAAHAAHLRAATPPRRLEERFGPPLVGGPADPVLARSPSPLGPPPLHGEPLVPAPHSPQLSAGLELFPGSTEKARNAAGRLKQLEDRGRAVLMNYRK
eukprot:TRINITY_DN37604_c0_g2_i1.p1 TRINITY_DN37604_c0_g2~~TRINITY_DN37604_c0_g2_i1.p1  ORF type:complete len:257 (+),score=75.03 TRINITY_DN37604_c0_g2_i1:76-846(+)